MRDRSSRAQGHEAGRSWLTIVVLVATVVFVATVMAVEVT